MMTVKGRQTAGFTVLEHIRFVLTSHSRHLPDLFLPALTLSPTLQLSLVLPLLHLPHHHPDIFSLRRLRRFEESHQHSHAEGTRFAPVDPIQT